MKQIGLVGGLGWISTAEYYRLLNVGVRDELGGHRAARVLVDSLDEQEFLNSRAGDPSEEGCEALIVGSVARLAAAGAEVIALCANGLHRFAPAILEQTGVEVIDIAQATVEAVEAAGLERVGLLGVKKTMEGEFYRSQCEQHGIEVLVPDEDTRAYVHDRIMDELTLGIFTDDTRTRFLNASQALVDRGAQGVILGCTEIPLLLDNDAADFPLFSTTAIHCDAIVRAALAP
jgi:aspartate racemase